MTLELIYAPNKIFKQISEPVQKVNDEIRSIIDQMFVILEQQQGIGLGANMVGILKRIIVINWNDGKKNIQFSMINPVITWSCQEMQEFKEASLSFPGIEANIKRPKEIKISYTDYQDQKQEMQAEGFLSTLIQHELDYLDGKVFLDHLSKLNCDRLLKKTQKFIKANPPHIHGEHCHH
jgi:peptide deformylase